jgi:hypothetical protein
MSIYVLYGNAAYDPRMRISAVWRMAKTRSAQVSFAINTVSGQVQQIGESHIFVESVILNKNPLSILLNAGFTPDSLPIHLHSLPAHSRFVSSHFSLRLSFTPVWFEITPDRQLEDGTRHTVSFP